MAARLADEGFDVVELRRTLLGRVRIVALCDGVQREVVVSRTTEEIIPDLVREPAESNAGGNGNGGKCFEEFGALS